MAHSVMIIPSRPSPIAVIPGIAGVRGALRDSVHAHAHTHQKTSQPVSQGGQPHSQLAEVGAEVLESFIGEEQDSDSDEGTQRAWSHEYKRYYLYDPVSGESIWE